MYRYRRGQGCALGEEITSHIKVLLYILHLTSILFHILHTLVFLQPQEKKTTSAFFLVPTQFSAVRLSRHCTRVKRAPFISIREMTAANKRSSTKKLEGSKKDHQQSTTPTPTEGGTTTNSSNADAMSTIASAAQNSTSGGGGPDNTTTTSNNNGNDPLEETTACVPLVYGSMAFYLGKKADEYSTHRWTLYLRGPNNEDLSTCVAKAIFQLHPSFAQPVRELTAPPFEVTEKGWGEFEAQIKIVWKDPKEKPTLLTHGIKLYPPGATNITPTTSKEPVIAENYDEVVFTNPAENFYKQLMRTSIAPKVQSAEPTVQAAFKTYADEDDFQKLIEAQKFLEKELTVVKERMVFATDSLLKVEEALREIQEAKKASSSSRKSKSSSSGGGASKKAKTSQS